MEYRNVHAVYVDMVNMKFEKVDVIVENPSTDLHALLGQVADALGKSVDTVKIESKEPVVKEYRRMSIENWMKYSEPFDPTPKNPRK